MNVPFLASVSFLMMMAFSAFSAPTNEDAKEVRITAELRDGSRIVGTATEKYFRFKSPLLGELKLAASDIRSVECLASNATKVVTANGDTLTVTFTEATIPLKTGFGKIEVAVNSLRKFAVSVSGGSGGAKRPGMVARWSGEDSGKDSAGNHDLELTAITYTDGQVGRAFAMNGVGSCMKLSEASGLNPGTDDGLTITAWIKPENVSGFHPILEWNPIDKIEGQIGVQLWLGNLPSSQGVLASHVVGLANETGVAQNHSLISAPGTIVTGRFQHVAVTYDKASGNGVLYVNGAVVTRGQWGRFTPLTLGDLWISRRPTDHPGDWTYNAFFYGLLDEICVYNRALTAEEIRNICIEENNGELPPAPTTSNRRPVYRPGTYQPFPTSD